jgi:hypothetical protein
MSARMTSKGTVALRNPPPKARAPSPVNPAANACSKAYVSERSVNQDVTLLTWVINVADSAT